MARHQLDRAAVQRLLTNPRGGVARDFQRRGQRVLAVARREIGVDTGQGRASLQVRPLRPPYQPGVEVGSDLEHVKHHLRGHGVIRPRRAKVLAFRPKGGGRMVFTRRVRAVAGNPFLQRALRAARGR
jgi:hypothetical protein